MMGTDFEYSFLPAVNTSGDLDRVASRYLGGIPVYYTSLLRLCLPLAAKRKLRRLVADVGVWADADRRESSVPGRAT